MKRAVLVILMIALVMCFAFMKGCNKTDTDTTTAPLTSVLEKSDAETTAPSGSEKSDNSHTEADNTDEFYIVTEEDDLEIMTAPVNNQSNSNSDKSEDKQDNTKPVSETQPQTENEKREETRIELPFIPAN